MQNHEAETKEILIRQLRILQDVSFRSKSTETAIRCSEAMANIAAAMFRDKQGGTAWTNSSQRSAKSASWTR